MIDRPHRRFYFRLALHLGKTVKQLLREIDSLELSEWIAYDAIEPFGEQRADLRAGIIASTTVNMWRDSNSDPAKPGDFMPDFLKEYEDTNKQEVPKKVNQIFGKMVCNNNPIK